MGRYELNGWHFYILPHRGRAGRPLLLSRQVTLYQHKPNQKAAGAGGGGGQTHDLPTRGSMLYQKCNSVPHQSLKEAESKAF